MQDLEVEYGLSVARLALLYHVYKWYLWICSYLWLSWRLPVPECSRPESGHSSSMDQSQGSGNQWTLVPDVAAGT